MDWYAVLRPRRSLTLPFLAVAVPALYFVYRDASIQCSSSQSCLGVAHAGYALVGLVGAYFAASAALALVDTGALAGRHPYARLALRPTDRTLAVLSVFVTAMAVYLLATLVTTTPAWLDLVFMPFGFVLALPAVAGYAAMVVVTNALFSEPPMWFQTAVVAVSIVLTTVWLFAVATGAASLLGSWLPVSVDSR
jgi:hypothetical protein